MDESGNQLALFGRRGARPFRLAEMQKLYLRNGQLYTVTQYVAREAAMKLPGLLFLAVTLCAQPALRTELRNGVVRVVALHSSGEPVTDSAPAIPGETLIVQGAGLAEAAQILIGGAPADSLPLDDGGVQITLPTTAGGSFVEIAIAGGNAATIPVDAPADAVQLSAAEVQALVNAAALSAGGARLATVVVDRSGRVLASFRRPDAADKEVEQALALARTGAFFSSQGTPLSSRTVRAISRVNFPEGIPNQPAGALFGIENTNRGCDFNVAFLPGQLYPRLAERRGHRVRRRHGDRARWTSALP